MSPCEIFSLSVANRKAGVSAPETPLLTRASARRLFIASRAPLQPAMRAATRLRKASSALASIAPDAQVGRKAPHRKIRLQRIDVDLDPFDRVSAPGVLRHERHVGIKQEA